MGKNLFDFGDQVFENKNNKVNDFNNKNNFETEKDNNINFNQNSTSQENIKDQAKKMYDKYSTYSQQDLISEFINTSKQKLLDGSLSKEKINQTASLLTPYLNTQQKEMLKELMDKIDV